MNPRNRARAHEQDNKIRLADHRYRHSPCCRRGPPVCPAGYGGGTPRIVVDQTTIDYGYVKFGETRTFAIAVKNTGDGVLRFGEKPYIEVLEGC